MTFFYVFYFRYLETARLIFFSVFSFSYIHWFIFFIFYYSLISLFSFSIFFCLYVHVKVFSQNCLRVLLIPFNLANVFHFTRCSSYVEFVFLCYRLMLFRLETILEDFFVVHSFYLCWHRCPIFQILVCDVFYCILCS